MESDRHLSDPMVPPFDLPILWDDGAVLVIDKPGGLATQAPRQYDSLESRLRSWLPLRRGHVGHEYLGIPHRLDRGTSGAIVFALRAKAARKLARQFERREVVKRYWTLVSGHVEPVAGIWRDWMRKVPDEPRSEIVSSSAAGAREAVLEYRTMAQHPDFTWLEVQLHTGRMHQVRLQGATRGHIVLGDSMYGSDRTFGPDVDDERQRWIALHARRLEFNSPATGERVVVDAPLPSYWQAYSPVA